MITSLKTLHKEWELNSEVDRANKTYIGYLCCPWCGYTDVVDEFSEYHHPYQPINESTGSTQCCQCNAAGPTAIFVLAYNPESTLIDCERFRALYLSELQSTTFPG